MKTKKWVGLLIVLVMLAALAPIADAQTHLRKDPCAEKLQRKACSFCPAEKESMQIADSVQSQTNSTALRTSARTSNLIPCHLLRFETSLNRQPSSLAWTNTPGANYSPDVSRDQQTPTQSGNEAQELAKKLSNPVASLISFPFQSNFDFNMGTGSGWRYTLNIQPVIPIALSPKWNLISRTIVPIIHQHNVANLGSQSGLGDITQSLFFSPADSKRFIWGAGPVFLIPTATNDFLGTEKFGIGPTVLVLKQQEEWTYGVLMNHIWSVAGSDDRASVNSTFLQPFLAYTTRDAWTFTLNTESSYDWTGNHWSVPIHFQVTKLIKFGKQPVSLGGALRCWATSPDGGPENCGLRIVITPLFPKK